MRHAVVVSYSANAHAFYTTISDATEVGLEHLAYKAAAAPAWRRRYQLGRWTRPVEGDLSLRSGAG